MQMQKPSWKIEIFFEKLSSLQGLESSKRHGRLVCTISSRFHVAALVWLQAFPKIKFS